MNTSIEKKIVLAITSALLVGAMASAAYADEPRSPLTDWNIRARRAEEAEAANQLRAVEQRRSRETREVIGDRMTGSMIEAGAGIENAINAAGIDVNSGWNILISVRAQIDTRRPQHGSIQYGSARGFDRGLMLLHVDGRAAIDPTGSPNHLPYLDLKIIPIAMTLESDSNEESLNFVGINFAQVNAHRDVRLNRDFRVGISVVGIDVRHRTEIGPNVDFILAAAANILGVRIQDSIAEFSRAETGDAPVVARNAGMQFASTELLMSFLFHSENRAWGGRITLGGSTSFGGTRSQNEDPFESGYSENQRQSNIVQTDVNVYAEAGFRVARFVELYTRIGVMQLRENGEYDAVQTRSITQFMTGATLHF